MNCSLLLCSKCKTKVHSKFKSADDHDVIKLKDIGKQQIVKPNLQNISCTIHPRQKVCLYCKTCNKLACPNCVSETHNKHDLDGLSKIYEKKDNNLLYVRDEFMIDLSCAVRDCEKLI